MTDSEYSYSLSEALAGRADDDRKRAKENRLDAPRSEGVACLRAAVDELTAANERTRAALVAYQEMSAWGQFWRGGKQLRIAGELVAEARGTDAAVKAVLRAMSAGGADE